MWSRILEQQRTRSACLTKFLLTVYCLVWREDKYFPMSYQYFVSKSLVSSLSWTRIHHICQNKKNILILPILFLLWIWTKQRKLKWSWNSLIYHFTLACRKYRIFRVIVRNEDLRAPSADGNRWSLWLSWFCDFTKNGYVYCLGKTFTRREILNN